MNSSPSDRPDRAHNQLVFADLTDYPVMAQALDNQWLPAELAADRQRAGAVAGTPPAAVAAASAEFRRALVNSGTLVVNRAFLLNNEAIYANYLPTADAAEYAAFAKLLNSRALVPYLYTERSAATEYQWGYDRSVHQAWSRMVGDESDPGLVRFDWDDERNADAAVSVSQFFSKGLLPLLRLQVPRLARDLGIPQEQAAAMRAGILKDISTWALQQDPDAPVTRNALYKEFITRPGTETHQMLLRDGEHIVHAKQLIDLLYNIGVPMIADSPTPLTPPDSPAARRCRRRRAGRAAVPTRTPARSPDCCAACSRTTCTGRSTVPTRTPGCPSTTSRGCGAPRSGGRTSTRWTPSSARASGTGGRRPPRSSPPAPPRSPAGTRRCCAPPARAAPRAPGSSGRS